MNFPLFSRLFLFVVFLLAPLSTQADLQGPEEWAGAHLKLVWLQDHGDGSDSLAHGSELMLYGYDSADGLGERPLLQEKTSFFKPLIMPDGHGVIVSNRKSRQMFLVDWETGKKKELGQGVAVAVWKEPRAGFFSRKHKVWVYCFSGLQPENKYGTSQPLYRFPIDNPRKKELIWDRTNLAWSNIQISRDGEILGGLFPWPHGGVLSIKDRQWRPLGRGCWTSLSPDNSKLLWIFDGLHRNIQIHDTVVGGSWKVNINNATGINGFEVYHPRWSNHPRYFVITGPYEKGEGGNRIGGGGEKVEIYAGRFDAQAKQVESWLQLTNNNRADFYPDLWIENGDTVDLDDGPSQTKAVANNLQWPTVATDLLFVWDNMQATNQLADNSPVGFYQCTVGLRGKALHSRNLQLDLTGGWGDTGDAGKKIGAVSKGLSELAVEFVLTPQLDQAGHIIDFQNKGHSVLAIDQVQKSIVVKRGEETFARWVDVLSDDGLEHHVMVNLAKKSAELFVNGKLVAKQALEKEFLMPGLDELVLGHRDGKWNGTLGAVAIYRTELANDQILVGAQRAARSASGHTQIERLIVEGQLLETSEIPSPDSIGAYSRALVVNSYKVVSVVEGEYVEDRIVVAEWAILDRQIVKEYGDSVEKLVLEKFSDHPELEGERQIMDIFEPDLDMYYRIPN